MNGFELDDSCAVTMNGKTYIFKAEKQSERYGKKYVLLLGRVRRLLYGSILCTTANFHSPNPFSWSEFKRPEILFENERFRPNKHLLKMVTWSFRWEIWVSTSSETKTIFKGPSKYKNKNPDVALLCFTVRESSQCWIYDDFKKKIRKFRAKTKDWR